jgi:stage III sporulation protein AB
MNGWLKWIGILLLVVALNLLGMHIAKLYKQRKTFWAQMAKMARYVKDEIRYTVDTPEKIIARYIQETPLLLEESSVTLPQKWSENLARKARETLFLPKEDCLLLCEFGNGLGVTDLEGQLNHCALYETRFSEKNNIAHEACLKKGNLYRKFCALASAAVVIMLL